MSTTTIDDLINNAEAIIQAQLKEHKNILSLQYLEKRLDPTDPDNKSKIDNEVKKVIDEIINRLTYAETKMRDKVRKAKIQALKQKLVTAAATTTTTK